MRLVKSFFLLAGARGGEPVFWNLQWNNDGACPVGLEPTLLYDKCWFCACDTCKLDILFLIDQSENAEPLCDNPLIKLRLTDQDLFSDLEDEFVFSGAKDQIDYAIDAIDAVPQEMLDNENVRIAAAIYGQQEDVAEIFNFGSTNKNLMKCKLYGYDDESSCDMNTFNRRPLCYQAGVYQALKWAVGIDIFTADGTLAPADFTWRTHTKQTPVSKALVLTAAGEFRSTDVNEENIATYLDAIHDVTHGGFDKIFTVGKVDADRSRSSEINFWRDLNEIACRNPQSCDQTSMYDVADAGRSPTETQTFHNGATFMTSIINPESLTLNPYFCYFDKWAENCMVKPITYHPRSVAQQMSRVDDNGDLVDNDSNVLPPSKYPWHGLIPNACCGIKPYNSDIRCCDAETHKLHSRCHQFDEDDEDEEGDMMFMEH